jgi:hypothetical protein
MKIGSGEKFSWLGFEHVSIGPSYRGLTVSIMPDITNPMIHEAPIAQSKIGSDKHGIWAQNIAANKKYMKNGVKGLWGTKKGKGAIIAGSGPSLQSEFLSTFSSKQWDIIACNDAYRLLEANAEYAAFLDAVCLPKWYSQIRSKTKAILSCFVNQEVPKQQWTRMYWYGMCPKMPDIPENTEMGEKLGWVQMAMNVTQAMMHFAYQCGYDRIVLVGCDFAYTGGYKHQGERLFHNKVTPFCVQHQVGGGIILTDEVLAMQARMHEAGAWFIQRKGVDVVNCTEGGILTGIRCMPLTEAISG